jgi:ABC-type uncharacterized transport system permease subunit
MNRGQRVALGIAAIVVGVLLYVVALALLWSWFLVPLGLPPIGLWHAYGIFLVLRLVLPANEVLATIQGHNDARRRLQFLLARPVVAMTFGFLASLAM